MQEYFLAVDGGGSKTEFCLSDCESGHARHFLSGSSNYKTAEADAERSVFLGGIKRIFQEAGIGVAQIRGLVMGMSGVDSPADHAHYLEIALCTGIPEARIYVCNDSELAFYSKGAPPGLCIVAGTGSVATGVAADRRKARSGGWSNYISDEGSGGWIGARALRELLRYCDGYDTYRPAFDALREYFHASSFETLPAILTRVSWQEIAATAKPVMELADAGDDYCADVVRQAARLVAEIAWSVYRKLDFERERSVDVVTAGSLFKCTSFYRWFNEALRDMVAGDNLRFCGEVLSPVVGGVALAKILFG